MTLSDQFLIALTAWRENRGGGYPGMQSVANVILNRAAARGTAPYQECVRPLQFTSICPPPQMTAQASEANVWPSLSDPSWTVALGVAQAAVNGSLDDITGGATNYYALSMATPPAWAGAMTMTVVIEGQAFYK
jgi:spore germination cell wall hydrolase CwlJ-like protein